MPADDTLTSDIDAFREAALSCPIPAAVELIGEKWAFLILRGALNGLQHFEEFQAGLGIARNILSDRLAQAGRGRNPRAHARSVRPPQGHLFADRQGRGLLPVVLALRQWGEEWGHGKPGVVLADRRDGKPVRRICVLSQTAASSARRFDLDRAESSAEGERLPLESGSRHKPYS